MTTDIIDQILSLKTWAIVGLSKNSVRPAFKVSALLQAKGHRIVPVHPKADTVHGEPGYASLAAIPFPIDVVDIFVNSSLAGAVVDEAISIKARAVWLQLNVIDESAYARAELAGLKVVMNRCPAIEYGLRN
jgi:predicted CoA-binding protein